MDGHQEAIDELHMIERQHVALREDIERVQDAFTSGADEHEILKCRTTLFSRLDAHMAFEEGLMRRHAYPLASLHTTAHHAFHDQFKAVMTGVDDGIVSHANISTLLTKVLKHHEVNHDDLFGYFLIDRYVLEAVEDGGGI